MSSSDFSELAPYEHFQEVRISSLFILFLLFFLPIVNQHTSNSFEKKNKKEMLPY